MESNQLARAETSTAVTGGGIPGTAWRDFVLYLDTSAQTVKTYAYALRPLKAFLSAKGTTTPSRLDILAYKRALTAQGKSPATVSLYMAACRLFFRWLATSGIYHDITNHIKGGKIDRAHHKRDALTAAQTKAVLSAIGTDSAIGARDYAMILVMAVCGLRDVEVARAKVGDFRNSGGDAVLQVFGKGRADAADIVILPDSVESAIRRSLTFRETVQPDSPLFVSASNRNMETQLTTRSISRIVKERFRTAGIDSPRLTAHSLRHTAVTLALLHGNDAQQVQTFARHASITTTMVYAHNIEETQAKASCSESVSKAIFNK